MTLHSGERQVAPTIDGIRADHVARYAWCAALFGRKIDVTNEDSAVVPELASGLIDCTIADIGCGVGYGSKYLADHGAKVIGIDNDTETLDYAREHYAHPNVEYMQRDLNGWPKLGRMFDAAVCFEIVEHLNDPKLMLRKIGCMRLIASVPNETVFPHATLLNKEHHARHYTKAQFEALLNSCGWTVQAWFTQAGTDGKDSVVRPGSDGWTLIADCVRS